MNAGLELGSPLGITSTAAREVVVNFRSEPWLVKVASRNHLQLQQPKETYAWSRSDGQICEATENGKKT